MGITHNHFDEPIEGEEWSAPHNAQTIWEGGRGVSDE
jgi:hypothetical protein